jgi:hypothetical protein
MTEKEWLSTATPLHMLWHAAAERHRKVVLFGVGCCRMAEAILIDKRSRTALNLMESYLDGETNRKDYNRAGTLALRACRWNGDSQPHRLAARAVQRLFVGNVSALQRAEWSLGDLQELLPSLGYSSPDNLFRQLLSDIFGNPFRPVAFDPNWHTSTAVALAQQMYDSRDFSAMPILADALQDAGCESDDVLTHCRDPKGLHVRGCWVVDLVLGKS